MIYKRCGRCGKRTESGTKCKCAGERHKEYDKYCRDQKSKAFYNSSEWQQAKETVLGMDQRIDAYVYMIHGVVMPADTVHHIVPLKEDWKRRTDVENLISISHATHSMIERKYKENEQEKKKMQEQLWMVIREFRELVRVGAV